MIVDYKDMRFSFRDKQIRRRRRLIFLLTAGLLFLSGAVYWKSLQSRGEVLHAQEWLLSGRVGEATARLDGSARWFYRSSREELRFLGRVLSGKLENLQEPDARGRLIDQSRFLKYMLDHALYEAIVRYSDWISADLGDLDRWYTALGYAGLAKIDQAERIRGEISAAFSSTHAKEIDALDLALATLRQQRIPYVFGRRGKPLAVYDRKTGKTVTEIPGLVLAPFHDSLLKGFRYYSLTLDPDMQRHIDRIMEPYQGTFVVLDVRDNAIVAAYSRSAGSRRGNTAFDRPFHPGSILKLFTLLAFLENGTPRLFPFTCQGTMAIAGRLFYDVWPHGTVTDAVEATALSCNLAFARMGTLIGREKLLRTLHKYRLDGDGWTDLFFRFPAGRLSSIADEYALGSLAAGIDHATLTTVHAAWLASLIASKGTAYPPYLVDHVDNVLRLGVYNHASAPPQRIGDPVHFEVVGRAMLAVTEHEQGTGKRSRVAGLRIALKTGTAGSIRDGLDTTIIGFFPFERPEYAFAFHLEKGGRADIQGAALVKDLVSFFKR